MSLARRRRIQTQPKSFAFASKFDTYKRIWMLLEGGKMMMRRVKALLSIVLLSTLPLLDSVPGGIGLRPAV